MGRLTDKIKSWIPREAACAGDDDFKSTEVFRDVFSKSGCFLAALTRRNKNLWTGETRFDKRAIPRGILLKEGLMKSSFKSPFWMSYRAVKDIAPGVAVYFS